MLLEHPVWFSISHYKYARFSTDALQSCPAYRIYGVWAKYRLPITGRPDIETVLRQRKETCKGSPQ